MPKTNDNSDKNWNDDWREELKTEDIECYDRLADCHNYRRDILKIAKLMYKFNSSNKTKEECLDRTIAWITDWNSQPHLMLDEEEYVKYLESI